MQHFQVLANTLVTMTAGIETSKRQLAEILKRVERLEDEQNWTKVPSNEATIAYKSAPGTMDRFDFSSSKLEEYNPRNQSSEVNFTFLTFHSQSSLLGLAILSPVKLTNRLC